MSEELDKPGEAEKPIEQPKGMSAEDVQAAIAKALEDERRKYQSKIDQVIAEKKAVESKTMTAEERLAKLEAELQNERATAKRKEAKALAGFDDELEAAILDYTDPDKAADAAQRIKARWESEKNVLMDKIKDLEQRLQYGSKAPPAGVNVDAKKAAIAQYNELVKQGRIDEAMALYVRLGLNT